MKLTLTAQTTARSTRIFLAGDLDYGTTGHFIDTVSEVITEQTDMADLHLDFTDLAFCDSAGISGLLLIHRRTSTVGLHLHLDHRPAHLDRVLDITGLLDFLTASPDSVPSETEIG